MVQVTVAWYSVERNIYDYHICLECWQYGKILRHHLRITPVGELPDGLELCTTCRDLMNDEDCEPIILEVT